MKQIFWTLGMSCMILFFSAKLLMAQYLTWKRVEFDVSGNAEQGILYYQIYRDTFPGFLPTQDNFFAATLDTLYKLPPVATNETWYYKVSCTDAWGNKSEFLRSVSLKPFVTAAVRIFLQAAMSASDCMKTSLSDNKQIPNESPYEDAKRICLSIPDNAVDWIKIGISHSPDGILTASRSFILRNDGFAVEPDGRTVQIGFSDVSEGPYYLHIIHRNHKQAVSASSIPLSPQYALLYDFTLSDSMYSPGSKGVKISNTEFWGLSAGDIDMDGDIDLDDFTIWYHQAKQGIKGYHNSDIDCDGKVTSIDYKYWYNTFKRN